MLDTTTKNTLLRLLEKVAYVPPAPAGPPMDPAMMGGAPPMDPSMMGGAPPMNPSMMGGAPPMDPAMMGGMPPMDPSMMGGMPEGMDMPVMLSMEDLKVVLQETVEKRISRMETMVEEIAKRMGVDIEAATQARDQSSGEGEDLPPYLQIPDEGMTDEAIEAAGQQTNPQDAQALQGAIGALRGA